MTQQQINMAHRRSLKSSYKDLSRQEKRIVKLQERINMLDKSIDTTYRLGFSYYGKDFRTHPRFQKDFELIFEWETEKEKAFTKINRIEEKYGLERGEVMRMFFSYNRSRSYHGSF